MLIIFSFCARAIIDQCVGKKASKVIAKRRVDMVSGNINSYARILNGPQQLDKICTYNDLAASMTTYKNEKAQRDEIARDQKKKSDEEKVARKAEKERQEAEENARLLPICQAQVQLGLEHVLKLIVKQKKNILKLVFDHPDFKPGMLKADCDKLLKEVIPSSEGEGPAVEEGSPLGVGTADVMALVPLPPAAALAAGSEANVEAQGEEIEHAGPVVEAGTVVGDAC